MAITSDLLGANETLKELTPEQVSAIVELSANDENQVIANKIGEVHGRYDADIKEALGLEKPAGVKTYDWLKGDILPQIKEASTYKTQIDTYKTKVEELEQSIKEGKGNEKIAQQLKDANDKIELLTKTHAKEKSDFETKLSESQNQLLGLQLNGQLSKDLSSVKFIDEKVLPKATRDIVINTAKEKVLATVTPEFTPDGVVYRSKATGQLMLNPSDGLKPYTLGQLVLAEESIKGILDQGSPGGSGDDDDNGGGGSGSAVSLGDAKTQREATVAIESELMKQGLERGSEEFDEAFQKVLKENKDFLSKLPMT